MAMHVLLLLFIGGCMAYFTFAWTDDPLDMRLAFDSMLLGFALLTVVNILRGRAVQKRRAIK